VITDIILQLLTCLGHADPNSIGEDRHLTVGGSVSQRPD
jgi:hypothetical protein